jgi:NADPH:quinone reductase-like Zn-dependent oxidoreductase
MATDAGLAAVLERPALRSRIRSFLDSGSLLLIADVVIDKVYPLGQAADAVGHMLGQHARGKVAIAA